MFGWLRNKREQPVTPSGPPPDARDRYAGKPLLILLENYVLDCVGALPPEKQAGCRQIVERVYGPGPDWKLTLRNTLQLGDGLDDAFRQMWERNQEIARNAGTTLSPEDFARMVVDKNFSQLIDPL